MVRMARMEVDLGLEFGVEVGVLSVLERRQRRFCGGQTPFGGAACAQTRGYGVNKRHV